MSEGREGPGMGGRCARREFSRASGGAPEPRVPGDACAGPWMKLTASNRLRLILAVPDRVSNMASEDGLPRLRENIVF